MLSGFNLVVFIVRIFDFYQLLIFVWCILSWIPLREEGWLADIVSVIDALVRPYISLFRRFLPPFGGLDLSPILALAALWLLERLILGILT